MFTWMKVEQNVQQTLVAPSDVVLVDIVERKKFIDKIELSHSGEIHEHDARVEAKLAIVGMPRKSIIPAHVGIFVFGRQGRKLTAIKLLKVTPYFLQIGQKQHVRVHVQ